MNGLSVGELCCLFCCPPCPSQIVAKLAFLPPPPTYKLILNGDQTVYPSAEQVSLQQGRRLCSSIVCSQPNFAQQTSQIGTQLHTNAKIVMMEKAEWQYGPVELEKLEVFLTKTDRGHQIACLYVRCTQNPKYTILFSHGNAVDLGQMSSFYYGLGSRLECNIFTYDYSGYGASGGIPNERNLYSDIRAAWNALRSRYGISPSNIILYGQSIGTVPTVDLASKFDCAGVVLHAPLMSGMRVAFNTSRTWCCDAFPSIDKVNKISSIVLVIHGTEDEVIDLSHGMAIHEKCPKAVDPLWVEGAGHNDVEIYSQYIERLKRFINEEVKLHQYSIMTAARAQQQINTANQMIQTNQPEKNDKSFTSISAPQNN